MFLAKDFNGRSVFWGSRRVSTVVDFRHRCVTHITVQLWTIYIHSGSIKTLHDKNSWNLADVKKKKSTSPFVFIFDDTLLITEH